MSLLSIATHYLYVTESSIAHFIFPVSLCSKIITSIFQKWNWKVFFFQQRLCLLWCMKPERALSEVFLNIFCYFNFIDFKMSRTFIFAWNSRIIEREKLKKKMELKIKGAKTRREFQVENAETANFFVFVFSVDFEHLLDFFVCCLCARL